MGSQSPMMTEGISKSSITIAPEHICDGHGRLTSGIDGTLKCAVDVRHIKMQSTASTAEGLRCFAQAHVWKFVGDKDDRVADFEFGMHDFAIGTRHAHQFFGAQSFLVKLDCFGSTADNEAWSHCVESLGNGLSRCSHVLSPSFMDRCSRTCEAENILAAPKSGKCKILKNSEA